MKDLKKTAHNMRKNIIELAYKAGNNGAHIAPSLSIVDILATLYCNVMTKDDRFILSKGHGGLCWYTALYEAGIITKEKLFTYEDNGGDLPGQPCMNDDLGITYSSGSLGLGLSFGAGLCIANKLKHKQSNTYVLLGDGELNEGSIWETAMFAAHNKLDNLIAIIDVNGLQSDGKTENVLNINIGNMWNGFGWNVNLVDGHSVLELSTLLNSIKQNNKPTVILAKTIKGYGISFMEHNNDWHHSVLIRSQYDKAITELNKIEESL